MNALPKLFSTYQLGAITLSNRLIMAPLTRGRAGKDRIPNELMAEHYAQRASAGLIIAEATNISEVAAGFDGVEIHSANGYLLDQFLRDGVNQRTDAYGGSVVNRSRLLLEVTNAVVEAWSADRVGIRLSPTSGFNDMRDSDPITTFTTVARSLNDFNLAYLHILEALPGHMLAGPGERVTPHIRQVYQGTLMINGGYDGVTGEAAIDGNEADLIAYGIPFLTNPDLPERIKNHTALNPPDFATFYTPGAKGYTDYPFLAAS
jgi:N-ethylmaleimide reductase